MQTKPKVNSVITHKVEGTVITFSVRDAGELMFDYTQASAANRAKAEVHGWIQRVSDAAAMARAGADGELVSPAELANRKFAAMQRLVGHYESGAEEWAVRGSGAGGTGDGLLLQALMRYRPGKSREELSEFVKALKPVERVKLLNSDKLRPIADALRAEMAKGVDADEMLSRLDELEAQG